MNFTQGGFAIGPEAFVGLKYSYTQTHNISKHSNIDKFKEFYPYALYNSYDISVGFFFAIWGTASVTGGVAYGPITLDNSLSIFGGRAESGGSYFTTWNPKLGFKYQKVWFKFGPSYALSNVKDFERFHDAIGVKFNFELLFRFE